MPFRGTCLSANACIATVCCAWYHFFIGVGIATVAEVKLAEVNGAAAVAAAATERKEGVTVIMTVIVQRTVDETVNAIAAERPRPRQRSGLRPATIW